MALFKIHKGAEKNSDGTSRLPSSYVEGYAYFATDTGRFYIDTANTASGRKMINPDAIVDLSYDGSKFKLTKANGTSATSAIYAPTSAGVAGQILQSNGSGAPSWVNQQTYSFAPGTADGTIAVNGTDIYVQGLKESALDPLYSKCVLHDIFAFCRAATPIHEASTDGSTWTELPLQREIFDQKDRTNTYIFRDGYVAHRWTWDTTTFSYGAIRYLLVKYSHTEDQPKSRLIMEAKPDSSWITIVDTEYSANASWKTIPVNGYSTGPIRITIQKADFSEEGTSIPLVALQCFSVRPGNQGQGIEYESPIDWDENRNILIHGARGDTPLVIRSGNTTSYLKFTNTNNDTLGWFGYQAQDQPVISCGSDGSNHIILHDSNYTSYCAKASHTHSYLPLAGGTLTGRLQVNSTIFGYNYSNSNNAAAFIFDKSGKNYTGIGANSETDTIYFGACDANGAWVTSYRQKWKFNGSLIVGGGDDNCNIVPWTNNYSTIGTDSLRWWKVFAKEIRGDSVYGAVWNDYAEFRQTVPHAKPGQVVIENGDGTQRITTERLQRGCNVVSDTFGFAIGETDECKTPIACAGRALVYTYENRYDFQPGEAVCSGPNGTVSRMTREEMINNPDCIVGFVSEIPEYKVWGTGNVEVDGRIWIKVN